MRGNQRLGIKQYKEILKSIKHIFLFIWFLNILEINNINTNQFLFQIFQFLELQAKTNNIVLTSSFFITLYKFYSASILSITEI